METTPHLHLPTLPTRCPPIRLHTRIHPLPSCQRPHVRTHDDIQKNGPMERNANSPQRRSQPAPRENKCHKMRCSSFVLNAGTVQEDDTTNDSVLRVWTCLLRSVLGSRRNGRRHALGLHNHIRIRDSDHFLVDGFVRTVRSEVHHHSSHVGGRTRLHRNRVHATRRRLQNSSCVARYVG